MVDHKIDRDAATRLLRCFFSPEMIKRVLRTAQEFDWDAAAISFMQVTCDHASDVVDHAISSLSTTDFEDFIAAIEPVFCKAVTMQIHSNLRGFDTFAGIECAAGFLGQTSIMDWVHHVIKELLKPLSLQPNSTGTRSSTSASLGTSTPATTVGTPEKATSGIPQFDGPSGMFDIPVDRTVQQVNLRGRTILEAWMTNRTTRDLSMMRPGQQVLHHDPENLNQHWTPRVTGGSPVYHGTSISDHAWARTFGNSPFESLQPRRNVNQMVTGAHAVVFTTFSPLRAFLWAAFQGNLPSMGHNPNDIAATQYTWECGQKQYRGVVVFQFHSKQQAPSGLTSFVIPEGKEAQWGSRSSSGAGSVVGKTVVWDHYRDLHGQASQPWPDLVHGLEYSPQLGALTPFRINMWRTIWKEGPATDYLNTQHAATYAISFDMEEPPAPAIKTGGTSGGDNSKKDGDKKDGDKKGGKKESTVRRLKNKASGFFRALSDGK